MGDPRALLELAKQIEKENQAIKTAKGQGVKYVPLTFENDDTPKQLLARIR